MVNVERFAGLRVIVLIEWLELGGAERQAVMLARELRRHAVDAEVWALGRDYGQGQQRAVASLCEQYGVPLHESTVQIPDDWRRWPDGLDSFAELLRRARPDILLPYWNKPNMVAGIVWRWTGAQTCIWGQRDEGRVRPPRWLEAIAVANTPWFISNSQIGADYLTQELRVPKQRVHIVHNGVDPPPVQTDRHTWRARLEIPQDAFAACMVAHLHRYKDHFTLLEAWKIFLDCLNASTDGAVRANLVLAGENMGTAPALQELAKRLEISQSVRFVGRIADVSGLVRAMDVCVHSSVKEGLPNAVLEAMHAGVPVVGTDIPGIREALGEQSAHFLVPAKDAVALAGRLSELYSMNSASRSQIVAKKSAADFYPFLSRTAGSTYNGSPRHRYGTV